MKCEKCNSEELLLNPYSNLDENGNFIGRVYLYLCWKCGHMPKKSDNNDNIINEIKKEVINLKTEKDLMCPLCNEKMNYKKVGDDTYMWSCETCPAILFEYYDDNNTLELYKYLKEG
jgi:hypothetical protein